MTSPVEDLRSAAVLLRQRAEAASSGPWEVGPTFGARSSRVYVRTEGAFDWVGSGGIEEPPLVIACQTANVSWFRANATYIATMDPLVGLALADLLDRFAYMYANGARAAAEVGVEHSAVQWPVEIDALALARLILGRST